MIDSSRIYSARVSFCNETVYNKYMDKIERARELEAMIDQLNKEYFELGVRSLKDDSFDQLWFELKDLYEDEDVKKSLGRIDMPMGTHSIHGRKIKHVAPVISLDKIKSNVEKTQFVNRVCKFFETRLGDFICESETFNVQPKLDGMTVVVYKKHGSDPVVVTRGGGLAGEDVTDQIRPLPVWPLLCGLYDGAIIRGEALIPSELSTNRSMVSGVVRSKQQNAALNAGVKIVFYEILDRVDFALTTQEKLDKLRSYGLEVVDNHRFDNPCDAAEMAYKLSHDDSFARGYKYPLDGVVIKPGVTWETIKEGQGHYRRQLAVKFPPLSAVTTLTRIEFKEGKNGLLTPIAEFDTVEIGGRSFSKASLGSWSAAVELGVYEGATVEVSIMNDIIPKITAVIKPNSDATESYMPVGCYVKGRHLYRDVSVVTIDNVLEMANMSLSLAVPPSVRRKLVENGVRSLYQLLMMDRRDYGLTPKKAEDLFISIDNLKREKVSPADVIVCYAPAGMGETTVRKLRSMTFDEVLKALPNPISEEWIDDARSVSVLVSK